MKSRFSEKLEISDLFCSGIQVIRHRKGDREKPICLMCVTFVLQAMVLNMTKSRLRRPPNACLPLPVSIVSTGPLQKHEART